MVTIMTKQTLNKVVKISKLFHDIINSKESMAVRFDKVMNALAKQTKSDGAVCFLLIEENYLELFAAKGLNSKATNQVALKVGDGIIGKVALNKRTRVVKDFTKEPDFIYRAGAGEEKFKSILASPIIRWGRSIGVFGLYKKEIYPFSKQERETLETFAMIFAEWAASDEMRIYKEEFIKQRGITISDKMKGVSLSRGYGVGAAVVHRRRQIIKNLFAEDKKEELERLTDAHTRMNADLDEKFNTSKLGLGEHADILDAYRMFAKDKGLFNKIAGHIDGGLTAEAAVERAYEDMWNRLSATQDTYLKERLHDLRDIADRLQTYLSGNNSDVKISDLDSIVLVAQTLGPADLMDYDYKKIKALILEDGTPTMHVAIVAKALGIPVVSKIKDLAKDIRNGDTIAVDGDEGFVYIRPSDKVLATFEQKICKIKNEAAQLESLKNLPAKTLDKQKVYLYVNIGLDFDLNYIESTNCDGVGLYRTEIPFMTADKLPDVETQISYYKKLFDKAQNKKIIFRSLDVGSDKLLPYWAYSGEENPAIGWRSIRITLDRRALLRQQMRAFIRAAKGKELYVMFPMIANLAEFRDAKETFLIELEKEKEISNDVPSKVHIGIMVEVPSVVFQLDSILPETDFISVGTNDLAQFIFACDRTNNRLANRYDVLSVSFLKVMKEIITKANQHNVLCSVCGEMASNPLEAMVLLGLGYRHLSSSGASFAKVKKMVRTSNTKELADYMDTLLNFNERTLRPQLIAYARDHGIEIS